MKDAEFIKVDTTDSNCSNKAYLNGQHQKDTLTMTNSIVLEKGVNQTTRNNDRETFISKFDDINQTNQLSNNTASTAVRPAIYEFIEGKGRLTPKAKEKKSVKRSSRRKRQNIIKSDLPQNMFAAVHTARSLNINLSPRDDTGNIPAYAQTANRQHVLKGEEHEHELRASQIDDSVLGKRTPTSQENINKNILNETFVCGFSIQKLETPISHSKLPDKLSSNTSSSTIRTFPYVGEKQSEGKLKDLRLGLGYNHSLSEIDPSSPFLQTLTIQGSTVVNIGGQDDRNVQTSADQDTKINDLVEENDRNPKKRRRTIPAILSKSKSSPTVRELLQRSRSYSRNQESPFNEDECKASIKISSSTESSSNLLPTTIPPKHASVNMSVNGSHVDVQGSSTLSSYSLCNKIGNERVFSKRYKNTRYSIPFKGPSIIIPKNYDAGLARIGFIQSPTPKTSDSLILPRLTEDDPIVIRDILNNSGRVTSLPTMSYSDSTSKTSSKSHLKKTPEKIQRKNSLPNTGVRLQNSKSRDRRKAKHNQIEHIPKAEYISNMDDSCLGNATKSSDLSVEGKAMQDSPQFNGIFKNTAAKKEFTTLKDYHESTGRQLLTRQSPQCSGVYQHPFVGKFSEFLAKKQALPSDDSSPKNNELDNFVPVPSNSTVLPQVSGSKKDTTSKSSSDCYFCDVEQLISNASLQNELEQISMCDHAYTKVRDVPTSRFPTPIGLRSRTIAKDSLEGIDTFRTVPVYAFTYGEQLLILPSPLQPGDPVTPATTPDPTFSGQLSNGTNQLMYRSLPSRGKNNKKINQRVDKRDKRRKGNRAPKVSSSKLEFVKMVNLTPVVSTKKKRTNLEKVIANIQKSRSAVLLNEKANNVFIARVIQIERSNDNIFTQISNVVELEMFDGADPSLKRWQEYEDYNVRLEYDNVSGAIKKIEADSLTSGFYKIMKTGMEMSNEQEAKTLATLQITLPNARTILNDLSFIAIGKIIKDCRVKRTPANIQKHSNLEYLLHSLASLCVVEDCDSHVSDRSYLPKVHSPKWYTGRLFESLHIDKQGGK
ncbi:hypothetical protein FSP39_015525 [Pinctada imbricata]|uniref:Uncharacterized protein n=1 Tax=Pinctada imbricata TaxID=66713 RepID=A0AA89BVT7_PINIB|nr:hypothetical protein FSP39_015525 [Pinctada imbricata]